MGRLNTQLIINTQLSYISKKNYDNMQTPPKNNNKKTTEKQLPAPYKANNFHTSYASPGSRKFNQEGQAHSSLNPTIRRKKKRFKKK